MARRKEEEEVEERPTERERGENMTQLAACTAVVPRRFEMGEATTKK